MDKILYKTRLRMDNQPNIRRNIRHSQETSHEEDQILFDVADEPVPAPPASIEKNVIEFPL
ncbi:MAG TPA: hypothetical protein PKW18_03630 [Candidatus Sumerlaeota bacterium]|nr:MAG: hypothetical protein BWY12_01514 [candidate division BRC1 bacterium ADurb.Bin183]HOE63570.1 hypothetical protein [Candidatus Sumerlaeota bacterium]HRR31369.1 hypothetical protein [Candidatus Sumerlaeia bacterium]HON50465.1 hypothetical protein [Candidatus Sumerlaeota bacterium]HOR63681.1 hypothetical protein [Candidatus Sumerlaeota bacterium]